MQKIINIENRIFYIYTLKCPETLEVKYVGVTCTTLSARLAQHIYDSKKKDTRSHKRNWISSLLENSQRPIIETIEVCDYTNWEEKEKYWIARLKNLTNTREGGKGVVLNRSEDSIKRSSEAKFKPIVCIMEDRSVVKYKSITEASNITKVPRTSIQYSITALSYSSYGINFLLEEDYYEGLEKTISIKPRKYKYKIIHNNIEYTPLSFSKKLNISETPVYLWCEGKNKWEDSYSYDGKEITIIKI